MRLRGASPDRHGCLSRRRRVMAHYTITPLRGGSFTQAEMSLLYYLADDRNAGVKIPAVYWMFLVRGEGVCFLVDTGPGDPEIWQQYHHAFERQSDEEPIQALSRVGVAPDDVQVVINTHLHWDHCNGNHLFPKAEVRVQARARSSRPWTPCPPTAPSTRRCAPTRRGRKSSSAPAPCRVIVSSQRA